MSWLDKNLPLLIAVGSAIASLWSMAMAYAEVKQTKEVVDGMRKTVEAHVIDASKHVDPVRDERRLIRIETAIEEWSGKLDEKFDRLFRMLVDIKNNTKNL